MCCYESGKKAGAGKSFWQKSTRVFAGKGTGVLLGWMAFAVLLLAVIFWVCFSVGKKPADTAAKSE